MRAYKEDHSLHQLDDKSRKGFYNELAVYNYEFRHEYAIYKEYEEAMNDGKLDEYHRWIMDFREEEKKSVDEKTLVLIENDTAMRESIYKKLKEGDKHFFMGRSKEDS